MGNHTKNHGCPHRQRSTDRPKLAGWWKRVAVGGQAGVNGMTRAALPARFMVPMRVRLGRPAFPANRWRGGASGQNGRAEWPAQWQAGHPNLAGHRHAVRLADPVACQAQPEIREARRICTLPPSVAGGRFGVPRLRGRRAPEPGPPEGGTPNRGSVEMRPLRPGAAEAGRKRGLGGVQRGPGGRRFGGMPSRSGRLRATDRCPSGPISIVDISTIYV
jgi:hypothetical protein